MPVNDADIQAFTEFARVRVSNGEAESMQQLFGEWLDRYEAQQVLDAIQRGEAEIAAGDGKRVDKAFDDIRTKLGWTK
jgi:hypothetical protein